MPDPSPWIEWHGGERPPIPDGVHYGVKFRDGEATAQCLSTAASCLRWTHLGYNADIVAYRLRDPGEWIENTGVRPVPIGTKVDVRHRCGIEYFDAFAGVRVYDETYGRHDGRAHDWDLGLDTSAITHWRLHQVEQTVPERPWIAQQGNECPVPSNTQVEWKLQHDPNRIYGPDNAGGLYWNPQSGVTHWRPADPTAWIDNIGTAPVDINDGTTLLDIQWGDGSIDIGVTRLRGTDGRTPTSWHTAQDGSRWTIKRWRLHQAESPRIEWPGTTEQMPVPKGTRIRVWRYDGSTEIGEAGDVRVNMEPMFWRRENHRTDIIAYQVLDAAQPAPAPEPPKDPEPTRGSLLDHLDLLGDVEWRTRVALVLAPDCSRATRQSLKACLLPLATEQGRDYLDAQDPTLRDVLSAIEIFDNNHAMAHFRIKNATLDGEHDLRVIRQRVLNAAKIIRLANDTAA